MAPFYPIIVRRSDGKLQIKAKTGGGEANRPTPSQLDQRPDTKSICDYYRLCNEGDAKEVEWRRKLAGMLVRELAPKEPKGSMTPTKHVNPDFATNRSYADRNFILAALPENYRLYEHVKYKATTNTQSQEDRATKNHAAGANERQDAYLYGHPAGRRKRFRSPAEFFPHLLWLCTDEAGDPDNCSCKLCCPEEIEAPSKPPVKAPVKETPRLKTPAEAIEASKQAAKQAQSKATRPTSATTSKPPAPIPLQPSALPRFKSFEQKLDAQPNKYIYRNGEVVWFARSTAWGLGVVVKRESNQIQYRIQPLSHPFSHPQLVSSPQSQLRPWLAWSPPPCTCEQLNPNPKNNNRGYSYEAVDWASLIQGRYGPGDPEVDGSILAAKSVENTFTPFDPIVSLSTETHYNGIYVGGEKIWIGDALRLRNGTFPTDIMVIHDIIEYPDKLDAGRPRIVFVGDTYCYRIVQLEPQAVPADDLHLPSRVREDLQFRNKITVANPEPGRRFTSFWRLNVKSSRLDISGIKGRWYESSALLPILDQNYATSRANGDVQDAGLFMNGQGDCNKPPPNTQGTQHTKDGSARSRPADTKMAKRESAFGKSVPSTFRISRGLDEPKKPEGSIVSAASPTQGSPTQRMAGVAIRRPSPEESKPQSHSLRSPDTAYPPHPLYGDRQQQQQQQQFPHGQFDPQSHIQPKQEPMDTNTASYHQQPPYQSTSNVEGKYDPWMKLEDTEMSGQDQGFDLPGFGQEYSSQQMGSLFGEDEDSKMEP